MNTEENRIRFWQDDKLVEINFTQHPSCSPQTTVLNYLRSLPDHKGTKEGCAEGDCGACTVVLAEPDANGKMQYRACDSCLILMPMIHGKQLITVESIGNSAEMHPVQEAMVKCDGSQCGYCTPGFIMSLFAFYKSDETPSRENALDALTGNLCRCTGYRSIMEAAAMSCSSKKEDQFSADETNVSRQLSQVLSDSNGLSLHTKDNQYFRPNSLSDALNLRAKYPEAQLVCGATDVGLLVTKKKQHLPLILDLSGVGELSNVSETPEGLKLGASLNLEKIKELSENRFPALYEMLAVFGSRQIRNLATLGGNLANASPIGDTPPVLMALDASVEMQSVRGTRTMKVAGFILGYRKSALEADELITAIIIPPQPLHVITKAYKISKRKDLDISTVSAGFRLILDESNTVEEILLVYGGMAAMTKRAKTAEDFLKGKIWSRSNAEVAMDLVEQEFTPISDARSGREGRRIMARNLLLKFWGDTQKQAEEKEEAIR